LIAGKLRSFYNRRFCPDCSPLGAHNTSKHAPPSDPLARLIHRARRRTESFLRYQRKRRRRRKNELISARGGSCEECGYATSFGALEFHHRDPRTKEFGVGGFTGSTDRLLVEAAKCDLLCANCHRLRHVVETPLKQRAAQLRQEKKARAVRYMGGRCVACGRRGPSQLFEFHHLDPARRTSGSVRVAPPIGGRRSSRNSRSASCFAPTATARSTPACVRSTRGSSGSRSHRASTAPR